MAWIKLDVNCPRHPKVAGLSDGAFRTWVQSICYASEFLTDGVVPEAFIRLAHWQHRRSIIAAGLWIEADGKVSIHDYLKYQNGRDYVEKERQRNRNRRHRTAGTTGGTTGGVPAGYRDQSTEDRVQRSEGDDDARARESRPAAVVAVVARPEPLIQNSVTFERRLRYCAFVGAKLEVPKGCHSQFIAKGATAADLDAWYRHLDAGLEANPELVPDWPKWLWPKFESWAKSRANRSVLDNWVKARERKRQQTN